MLVIATIYSSHSNYIYKDGVDQMMPESFSIFSQSQTATLTQFWRLTKRGNK